jgi:hypothetical protein
MSNEIVPASRSNPPVTALAADHVDLNVDAKMASALSVPQMMALEMLASGLSPAVAAQAAGVSRATVYRWLRTDAAFTEAHQTVQRDLRSAAQARLAGMADAALNAVGRALADGDARIALAILRDMKLTAGDQPEAKRPSAGGTVVELVQQRLSVSTSPAALPEWTNGKATDMTMSS